MSIITITLQVEYEWTISVDGTYVITFILV